MIKKAVPFILWAVLAAALLWAAPAAVHHRIAAGLEDAFKDARVSVGRLSLERPLAAGVSDILIEAEGYRISVPKATVDPKLKLTLIGPKVRIRSYPELQEPPAPVLPSARRAPAFPGRVEVRDAVIELKLPNVQAEVRGSLECDLRDHQLKFARLQVPALKSGKLKVESIALDLPGSGETGVLTAEKLSFEKLEVTELRGEVVWEDMLVDVRNVTASWVRGAVLGQAKFQTQDPFAYEADLEVRELDLDALTEAMKLKNKMSADGKLTGKVSVKGDRSGILRLEGRFDAGAGGGDLVIRDPNFLKYLAENTRQPMALVEAAFKEYHFDTGSVALGKDQRNLGLSVNLSGAKGRRDFEINLHDVL
jgi:hypothetical protein